LIVTLRPPVLVGDFVLPRRLSGRPLQALYQLDAIAVEAGWTPELLHLAGDLWREAGDITRALSYWRAAGMNTDEALLRDMALAELEVQDWAQALDTLNRLARLAPDDAWVQFQLGLIQSAVDPSAALEHLTLAARESAYADIAAQLSGVLRNSTGDAAGLVSVGQALAERELWAHAELAFTRAVSIESLPEALAYAGFARAMQAEEGGDWIDRAVALAPTSATVRLLQGLYLRRIGDYEGSQRALAAAAGLDPQNPVMFAELGTSYQLLGDLMLARRWLEQALALSDGDSRFQERLDELTSAEAQLLRDFGVTAEATDDATAEPVP
jgi:Flp pilus assembly protein TadD